MNINSILSRANEAIIDKKSQLVRLCLIIGGLSLIPDLFDSNQGFLSIIHFVLLILLLPVAHGYIVTFLKLITHRENEISDDDAFVGITRFKDLFATYLVRFLFLAVVGGIIGAVLVVITAVLYSGIFMNIVQSITYITDETAALEQLLYQVAYQMPSLIGWLFICTIIVVIASIILDLYTFAVPYLLEEKGYKNFTCIKESISFIKGHKWDLFKLELHFIGWFILSAIIGALVGMLFAFLGTTISSVTGVAATLFFTTYTYLPRYQASKAIFYKEIAYYRYSESSSEEQTVVDGELSESEKQYYENNDL